MKILAPYTESLDIPRITLSTSAPSSPLTSDIWIDTDATASVPAFRGVVAKSNATQAITNGNAAALDMQVEEKDSDGFHEGVTNPSRFTIPTGLDGSYLLVCRYNFTLGGTITGPMYLFCRINGVDQNIGMQVIPAMMTASSLMTFTISAVLPDLAATNYVQPVAENATGATVTFSASLGVRASLHLIGT